MALRKIVKHTDSLLYNCETEITRIVGPLESSMKMAREKAREQSGKYRTRKGLNCFYMILTFNTRLNEWMYSETWRNGYQED